MLTVRSTIEIASQASPQIIPVVQGDTGREILFTLADFTIPTGATATFYIQKPSGNAVYNTATIDGNTVLVELTAQSIIEIGDNYGQVRISKNSEVVTSFDFILLVKPFRGIEATESTTEMNIFDQAVAEAMEQIDSSLDDIVAEEYDSTSTYDKGEYCLYDGKLYVCSTAITTAEAWNSSHWTAVTVGEALTDLKQEISQMSGLSDDIKTALLQIAAKVAYIDDDGQDYYDALEAALYPPAELESISAVYTQATTVYPTTSLNSLKTDLVVTAHYTDSSSETVTTYTLSGTLSVGTSTITVTYEGKTTTFNVTVTAAPTLSSISAVYTQSGTVYTTTSLDSLKSDLVVTATYSDTTTATVASTDYTLSGTLEVGTSTVTVSYGGKTDTFSVTVSQANTTAQIDREGYILAHRSGSPSYYDYAVTNGGITEMYNMDAPTTTLFPAGIIPTLGSVLSAAPGCLVVYDSSGNPINYVNETGSPARWVQTKSSSMTEYSNSWTVTEYSKIAFSLDTRCLDDAYMYDKTTGKVFFAGVNTPYYGKSYITD